MRLDFRRDGKIPETYRVLYEETAREVRSLFAEMIDSISRRHPGDLDWLLCGPASRNVFRSPLFFRCCRVAFLQKLLDQNVPVDTVITDSPALARALRSWLHKGRRTAEVTVHVPFRCRLERFSAAMARLLGYPVLHLWQLLQARSTRTASSGSLPGVPLTLVDTFAMSGFVEEDRYYPGLLDFLTAEEQETVYFVPTLHRIGPAKAGMVFRRLRACGRNVLLKEDHLKLSDYLFAFGHALRIQRKRIGEAKFRGIDLSGLIREEIRSLEALGDALIGILNYRFAFRLKQAGVDLRLVIDWFENQVGDKGWNAGFNAAFPQTPTLGYMGFVNTDFYLCARPTVVEKESGALPRTICVMGEGLRQEVGEFCRQLIVKTAPAFRFSHLYRSLAGREERDRKNFNVLVALPFSGIEAERILSMVAGAASGLPKTVVFRVKPHPTAEAPHLLQRIRNISNIRVVEGDFSHLQGRSDLLFSTASSVCMETLARGIPVIIAGDPAGLTLNPIPGSLTSDLWCTVHHADAFMDAIEFYAARDNEAIQRHRREGERIRDSFFLPVTEAGARSFLRMPTGT